MCDACGGRLGGGWVLQWRVAGTTKRARETQGARLAVIPVVPRKLNIAEQV